MHISKNIGLIGLFSILIILIPIYLNICGIFFFARFIFVILALCILLNRLLLRPLVINMILHGHCAIILLVTSNRIP